MPQRTELEALDFLLSQVCRLHYVRAQGLLDAIGIYRGQPPVLYVLHEQEGQTQSELAARLEVAPATVTKMLQRLERAGFVQRQTDSEDQRVSRVYLTDAGRAIQGDVVAVAGPACRRDLRRLHHRGARRPASADDRHARESESRGRRRFSGLNH